MATARYVAWLLVSYPLEDNVRQFVDITPYDLRSGRSISRGRGILGIFVGGRTMTNIIRRLGG
jgi:hypothetical protein